jgi:hypothetical protein
MVAGAPFVTADYDEGDVKSYRGIVVAIPNGPRLRFVSDSPLQDVADAYGYLYGIVPSYDFILNSSSLDNLAMDLRESK